MKTIKLILLLAGILVTACTEDNLLNTGEGDPLSEDASLKGTGNVITIPPNGTDDTDNLLDAFATAAPGTVIRLTDGVYHVGYMEVREFCGSLVGAGKDRTILYPVTPIDSRTQNLDLNLLPAWWRFIGGDIKIAGMTFNTTVPEPIQNYNDDFFWGKDLYGILMCNSYDVNAPDPDATQRVVVRDAGFIGGYDDAGGDPDSPQWRTDHNTILGFWAGLDYNWPYEDAGYTLTKGEYTVENCSFDHIVCAAEGFGMGNEATMTVTSCSFNDCATQAYFCADFGSKVYITRNEFSGTTQNDILIEDLEWGVVYGYADVQPVRRSQYFITENTFHVVPNSTSVLLWDTWLAQDCEDILPMQFLLKGNVFKMAEGSTGITAINSQDAVIKNNRFTGNGLAGILVDGIATDRFGIPLLDPDQAYADNALVLGNNFSLLESEQADIILGERSRNCTVVGGSMDAVIDQGTGNRVIGLKPSHQGYHFGPGIRDHMTKGRGSQNTGSVHGPQHK